MTCIVGLVSGESAYIGADSLVSIGWTQHAMPPSSPKVIRSGDLLIGSCGQLRANNVLRFEFTPPAHHPAELDDMTYIGRDVVNAMRECFKSAGVAKISESVEEAGGSQFLIAYRGALYQISDNWATLVIDSDYQSIGSGAEVALGALYASSKKNPVDRITVALEAAALFNSGCGGPFVIEEL